MAASAFWNFCNTVTSVLPGGDFDEMPFGPTAAEEVTEAGGRLVREIGKAAGDAMYDASNFVTEKRAAVFKKVEEEHTRLTQSRANEGDYINSEGDSTLLITPLDLNGDDIHHSNEIPDTIKQIVFPEEIESADQLFNKIITDAVSASGDNNTIFKTSEKVQIITNFIAQTEEALFDLKASPEDKRKTAANYSVIYTLLLAKLTTIPENKKMAHQAVKSAKVAQTTMGVWSRLKETTQPLRLEKARKAAEVDGLIEQAKKIRERVFKEISADLNTKFEWEEIQNPSTPQKPLILL